MRVQIKKMWSVAHAVGLWLSIAAGACASASTLMCPAYHTSATPQAATLHIQQGFAVRRIITDRVLHQTWAIVEDCSHPERPLKMILLPESASAGDVPSFTAQKILVAATPPIQPQRMSKLARQLVLAPVSAPSRPVMIGSPIAPLLLSLVLVHPGDRVHLWSASTNVRMEIEAVALDYGHAGQVIHLRRIGNNHAQTTMLAGLVDGADSAELLP
jgi:hypothetical protein